MAQRPSCARKTIAGKSASPHLFGISRDFKNKKRQNELIDRPIEKSQNELLNTHYPIETKHKI
ncbi:MAG: hypothetical protein A3J37_08460 [Alphaproteobacteria bacterium RIFCSPHIGHO2_12_FULL_45_9]|nr:MAG: hypothetical protein A3B66_06845 [Alphaproteobacteria bacterium RIFCSPHIGHO2_02_FULL_46_13]OFW94467.1 MAG: hypothetical protein A3J37_08460 [Alphaproteobacteria bacterium RIFCSPHIGHO2_12_FULL_45_9]